MYKFKVPEAFHKNRPFVMDPWGMEMKFFILPGGHPQVTSRAQRRTLEDEKLRDSLPALKKITSEDFRAMVEVSKQSKEEVVAGLGDTEEAAADDSSRDSSSAMRALEILRDPEVSAALSQLSEHQSAEVLETTLDRVTGWDNVKGSDDDNPTDDGLLVYSDEAIRAFLKDETVVPGNSQAYGNWTFGAALCDAITQASNALAAAEKAAGEDSGPAVSGTLTLQGGGPTATEDKSVEN